MGIKIVLQDLHAYDGCLHSVFHYPLGNWSMLKGLTRCPNTELRRKWRYVSMETTRTAYSSIVTASPSETVTSHKATKLNKIIILCFVYKIIISYIFNKNHISQTQRDDKEKLSSRDKYDYWQMTIDMNDASVSCNNRCCMPQDSAASIKQCRNGPT